MEKEQRKFKPEAPVFFPRETRSRPKFRVNKCRTEGGFGQALRNSTEGSSESAFGLSWHECVTAGSNGIYARS